MNEKEKLNKKWEVLEGLYASMNEKEKLKKKWEGAGILDGLYASSDTNWNFIDIPNDKELTIDISKRSVKMFDFAGVISEYVLKKFKSIILNEKEEDVIVTERNLLPGEFSKIREHLEGEVLLEFEETPDRYGSKYILFPTTQFQNIAMLQNIAMPLVQRVAGTTVGNDLVTVQPLNATVGNLFHMDYYWHDNINTGINNTYITATNNLELIA